MARVVGRGLALWSAILVVVLQPLYAYNWAQISGETATTAASVQPSPWKARWGHAVVAIHYNEEKRVRDGKKDKLVLIGGDSHHYTASIKNGSAWQVVENRLQRTELGQPTFKIVSKVTWQQINPGKVPPTGVTYRSWIACAANPWSSADRLVKNCENTLSPPGAYINDLMFSPRRGHAAVVFFEDQIVVLGGRAREISPMKEDATLRGLIGPLPKGWREKSVLKNDVWKSDDEGATWTLVTPGCSHPNRSQLLAGGTEDSFCRTSADCDGDSECVDLDPRGVGTCVCRMWSGRESHAAAVFNGRIYIAGGVVAVRSSICGWRYHESTFKLPLACGDGYDQLVSDVWSSSNGREWQRVTENAPWGPRRGLSLISLLMLEDDAAQSRSAGAEDTSGIKRSLLVVGGLGLGATGGEDVTQTPPLSPSGDNLLDMDSQRPLGDVWRSADGAEWRQVESGTAFSPRSGHVSLVIPSAFDNRIMEDIVGDAVQEALTVQESEADGASSDEAKNSLVLQASNTAIRTISRAAKDREALLVIGGRGEGDLMLGDVWSWCPTCKQSHWTKDYGKDTGGMHEYVAPNSELSKLQIVSPSEVELLSASGFSSIEELASGSRERMLHLRHYMKVCDFKVLAEQIVEKCSTEPPLPDGWEFRDVEVVVAEDLEKREFETSIYQQQAESWDGCKQILVPFISEETGELIWPPVNGISQIQSLASPFPLSKRLPCRWQLSPRTGHAGAVFHGIPFVFGGKKDTEQFSNDVWYRDTKPPVTRFKKTPDSGSAGTKFEFECDESACLYEYKVEDHRELLTLRNWTRSGPSVDLGGWLEKGEFVFTVRAMDSAGNVDPLFDRGRNVHIWVYTPLLPWALIITLSVLGLITLVALGLEWRRRRRKAAMHRYAMKRMKRKMMRLQREAQQRDVDWKKYYEKNEEISKEKAKGRRRTERMKRVPIKKKKGGKDGGKSDGSASPKRSRLDDTGVKRRRPKPPSVGGGAAGASTSPGKKTRPKPPGKRTAKLEEAKSKADRPKKDPYKTTSKSSKPKKASARSSSPSKSSATKQKQA